MGLIDKIWNNLYKGISVRKKIITSFFWIFFILATCYAWVVLFQKDQAMDSYSVDLAGKTRLLSEKIILDSHLSLNDDERISSKGKEELQKAIQNLSAIYETLSNGGRIQNIEGEDVIIKSNDDWKISSVRKEIHPLFLKYKDFAEVLIKEPKYLPKTLVAANDTSTSIKMPVLNPKITAAISELNHYSLNNELLTENQNLAALYVKHVSTNLTSFLIYFSLFFLIAFTVVIFNAILIYIYLVRPIDTISRAAEHIASGDINTKIQYDIDDELGKVVGSVNTLTDNLRKTTDFITRIGKGDFDAEFKVNSVEGLADKDNLSFALVNMRNQLKTISDEDRKRNWVTEGLAKFGELLRKGSDDVETLSYDIIYNLVKYLDANQGSIFIVTETDQNKEVLELKACYAWDRKKFRNMQINLGEGLVGQAWQENETVHLSDFPENYIEITSGLGKANPNNLLIVPLKLNEKTYGIIEIASFKEFQLFQREFIEKIGESIASTVSSVKINSQTKKLLQETQQQSEEMRAQEEEMRQNMEEMQATQEEMTRKEQETKKMLVELKQSEEQARAQEEEIRQNLEEMHATQEEMNRVQLEMKAMTTIIDSVAIVSKTDLKGNITYVNDEFTKWSKYTREELMGKNHRILKSGHQPDAIFVEMWKTISSGKIFRGEIKNKAKDGSYYWVDAVIAPVLDDNGKPKEYIAQRFVINEKKKKEEETHEMLEEMRAQEEQMRQNMEELAHAQEEILQYKEDSEAQRKTIHAMAVISKTDSKGNLIYVNDEWVRLSKYSREEVMGKNPSIIVSGYHPETFFTNMWNTVSGGKIWRNEVKNKAKDGSYYWVDTVISPIMDASGKPKEYVSQGLEITEKKKKEELLLKELEELKRKK